MLKALTIANFTIALCCAQQQYRLVLLTGGGFYRFAEATQLSDNGSAIGRVNANGQPVVFTSGSGVIIPGGSVERINAINASGDIVGSSFNGHGVSAFLSRPPYDTLIDLNPVFNWYNGEADVINDLGDIIGTGNTAAYDGPNPFDNWFPGLNVSQVTSMNNARQIIGSSYLGPPLFSQFFLYSPGKGATVLPAFPLVLNNRGDVLFGAPGSAQYIQTSSVQIPLPSEYSWVSMNDSDQAVGYAASTSVTNVTTVRTVFFSVATGLVDISARIVDFGNCMQIRPAAINNRGQIAVNCVLFPNPVGAPPGAGVGLLVPLANAAMQQPAQVPAQASALGSTHVSARRVYHFNGVPVQTSLSAGGPRLGKQTRH